MTNKFKGTGVAIVTPFTEDGNVDYPSLEKLIGHLIMNEIDYVVSLGTTGESVTLTMEEKKEVLKVTIKLIAGRVPLVAGIGGNNTAEIVQTIQGADFEGVDGILSV